MNLVDTLNCEEYLMETCHCGIKVGDPVTVDGVTSRGIVVRRNGRRLTVQFKEWGKTGYRAGWRKETDMSFVHKLGKGPGEV